MTMRTAHGVTAEAVDGGRRTRRRRGSAVALAVVLTTAGLLASACGTVDSPLPAQAQPLPAVATAAAAEQSSSSSPTASRAPACGDPTASLRPPAQLPEPGAMPAGSQLRRIADRGHLTAGVLADVPPFGYIDPISGEFAGFDVALARLIGRAIFGVDGRVRFRAVTYAERIPVVRDGTVDLVVANMSTSCERLAQVDFSAVYYDQPKGLLVVTDSPYRSLADLAGRPVCAATGTTSLDYIRSVVPTVRAVAAPTPADCLVRMQTGTVDGIWTTEAVLAGMQAQDPRTVIVGAREDPDSSAIAVSKNHPELTRFINGALARFVADGSWDQLTARWLAGLNPIAPVPHYRD